MKKHIILSLALLCQVLSVAAEDKVYISDFSIKAGETKRIALCFDTDRTDITRLQGTVMMPAGLTVQNQSDVAGTYVWITGNDARTGGAVMSYNYATGGVMMTSGTFTAATGAVAYIDVMASSSLAENSTITISGFKVMNNKSEYTNVASENCTVTRDASGQGGEQSGEVSFAFSPESLTLVKGQTATVDVTMTNSMALTGMQATLTASTGLTVTSVTRGSRLVGQFHYNDTKGTMVSLGSISGNEGTVFTVGLKADDDFTGSSATLTISGLNVTTSSAQEFTASDITLNVTIAPNKTALNNAITEAEAYYNTISESNPDAAAVLQTAINTAKGVQGNADATESEVDTAAQTLTDALNAAKADVALKRITLVIPAKSYMTRFDADKRQIENAVAGVKLYSVNNVTSTEVVLTAELSVIAAEMPYFIYNDNDTEVEVNIVVSINDADAVDYDSDHFKGTLVDKTFTAEDMEEADHYVLSNGHDFVWVKNAGTLAAGKCWIELSKFESAGARRLTIVHEGETNGISTVKTDADTKDAAVYDLQGRRVMLPTRSAEGRLFPKGLKKGLFIVNGKKVVIK